MRVMPWGTRRLGRRSAWGGWGRGPVAGGLDDVDEACEEGEGGGVGGVVGEGEHLVAAGRGRSRFHSVERRAMSPANILRRPLAWPKSTRSTAIATRFGLQVILPVDMALMPPQPPWHLLYFLPLPQGHGSFRPTFLGSSLGSCRHMRLASSSSVAKAADS